MLYPVGLDRGATGGATARKKLRSAPSDVLSDERVRPATNFELGVSLPAGGFYRAEWPSAWPQLYP